MIACEDSLVIIAELFLHCISLVKASFLTHFYLVILVLGSSELYLLFCTWRCYRSLVIFQRQRWSLPPRFRSLQSAYHKTLWDTPTYIWARHCLKQPMISQDLNLLVDWSFGWWLMEEPSVHFWQHIASLQSASLEPIWDLPIYIWRYDRLE